MKAPRMINGVVIAGGKWVAWPVWDGPGRGKVLFAIVSEEVADD